ncbi:MAG: hypothetical protein JWO15_1694 [Sphingomonadales bacterium]|nr:hypothetical protein [Sphingomonadales bacterium]
MTNDFEALDQAKKHFAVWAASLEPAGMVDEESGLTTDDVHMVAAMLEVSLIVPPRLKMGR